MKFNTSKADFFRIKCRIFDIGMNMMGYNLWDMFRYRLTK